MDFTFQSIDEDLPGPKWRALFDRLWPAYREWFLAEGIEQRATYVESRDQIERHMPRLTPTYDRLVELAGGQDLVARFLSLYNPPGYIAGCSQVVWPGDEPVLIRNYDYAPGATDGVILHSSWNGMRAIAMVDSLIGALDGVNEAGLAVSLTFGGRRVRGDGFGVPIIVRYLLEFCETTAEAAEVLARVPSFMAHNVTVVDRGGKFVTAFLSPDRPAVVRQIPIATNHQGEVEWHNHARATATLERENFLSFRLSDPAMTAPRLADAFLRPPLYTRAYAQGYGTIYTAVYYPRRGLAEYRWPGVTWRLSFDDFKDASHDITFAPAESVIPLRR
ncbi:MAG: hypothetical protein GY791_04120 [Alphaproteobacteria bacterium]|nr:hypothetical protein [Alphaproteobacteria bacterium]